MKQIRWIWSLTKKKRGMILGLLVLVSVIAVFQVCLAVAVQLIVDKAQGKGAAPLSFLMTAVVLTGLVSMLLDGIKLYLQNNSILSLDGRLREKLLIHMEKIPVEKSQSYHSGDMLTRLTEDSAQSARVIPESIVNMAAGIFSFLFAFAYAFLINWKIALALVLLSPLPVIFSNFLMPALQKWTLKAKDGEGKVRGYLQEQLATLVTIKCFSCYEKSAQDFSQLFGDKKKKQLKSVKIQAVMNAGSGFLGIMINFAAIGLGAWYVIRGEMSIGAVLGLVQVSNYISWPFIQMIPLIGELQNNLACTKRVIEVMEIPEEPQTEEMEAEYGDAVPTLCFQDVSFGYGEEGKVMEHFTREMGGNRIVGIFGPSGCGKSTFLKLALGLYEPQEGEVAIWLDEKKITGTGMRSCISYVPQDHILHTGTVEENIRYGNRRVTFEDVRKAAVKANIHDTILELPEGYDTVIEENGKNLSFGQAQRIIVARALLSGRPVLVFDEPTASLDPVSRDAIINTLLEEAKAKLCIIVSHDYDLKKYCDKIIELAPAG